MIPGTGWLPWWITWGAIYAFEILCQTADARMQAPEILSDTRDGVLLPLLGLILVLGAVLLQPGFVISLAMDGSLLRALNPAVECRQAPSPPTAST
jgi:hypothetical protein